MSEEIWRYLSGALFGIIAVLAPTFGFAAVLMLAILIDCWSAWDLNRRLHRIYPENVDGKFKTSYAMRIFRTFLLVYSVVLLMYLVDTILLPDFGYLNLGNVAAAVFCGIQVFSILENISSGNGAAWAKVLQRFLTDKAKRHFKIQIDKDIWGEISIKPDFNNTEKINNITETE